MGNSLHMACCSEDARRGSRVVDSQRLGGRGSLSLSLSLLSLLHLVGLDLLRLPNLHKLQPRCKALAEPLRGWSFASLLDQRWKVQS